MRPFLRVTAADRNPARSSPRSRHAQTARMSAAANLTKHNITELAALVKTRLKRMQYRPGLLDGFLVSTGSTSDSSCNPGP
jgi:hypothetical protein